ncbi:MAG TPA: exodeoxyribonuclease III [Chitinivibrionales bacterium]|nr:exodeoxyribonuclease III [Chitinivibrionales bacterium]
MRILSWNVNGIRAVAKKGMLDRLVKDGADIICLQETKVFDPQELDESILSPQGYSSHWNSAQDKKGYSGVAVYTKRQPKKIEKGFGVKKFDTEGRTLVAHYDGFTLLNIYFPNGKQNEERLKYKMDFYDAFLAFCDGLRKKKIPLIMCGDYNTAHKEIDLARPKENAGVSGFLPEERAWIDKYLTHGYIDTLRMFHQEPGLYTWWDLKSGARARNVGWRIDYFFVSDDIKGRVKDGFILKDVMGSDHCPIGIDISR